jgi:short-subunit dehydrogenase
MIVFLTGASSGIGESMARHYAARGATLGLVARREDRLHALKATLATPVEIYPVDVRDHAGMVRAAEDFIARRGLPDLVIANAGVARQTITGKDRTVDAFRETMDTNVLGMVHTFQPFVVPMRHRGSGQLVGVASVAGFRGTPVFSAYAASKAAAIAYLEGLRVELRGSGVGVTTLCPGFIESEMTATNRFPMPFLLPTDDAVERLCRAIAARKSRAVIPWQMAIAVPILRLLPPALYDTIVAWGSRRRGQ